MEERWMDIERFNGLFQISDYGRLKIVPHKKVAYINNNKYVYMSKEHIYKSKKHNKNMNVCTTNIYWNGKRKTIEIAREVARCFMKKDLKTTDVILYKDGNFMNCRLDNLIIIDRKDFAKKQYYGGHYKRLNPAKKYEYCGEMLTLKQLSKISHLKQTTVKKRLTQLFWNTYEAVEIPVASYKKKEEVI